MNDLKRQEKRRNGKWYTAANRKEQFLFFYCICAIIDSSTNAPFISYSLCVYSHLVLSVAFALSSSFVKSNDSGFYISFFYVYIIVSTFLYILFSFFFLFFFMVSSFYLYLFQYITILYFAFHKTSQSSHSLSHLTIQCIDFDN